MRKALSLAFIAAALLAGAGSAVSDSTARSVALVETAAAAGTCPVPGQRVKTSSSPAIYVVDPDGRLYWIPSPEVYLSLFRPEAGVTIFDNLFADCYGGFGTLSKGHLAKASGDAIYIWDGHLGGYRWITSPAVFDKYSFAPDKVTTVTSASPVVGEWRP
ncbi:hypothetical protein LFM09_37285 [Lentzea alba]|uniref:hypothetical protein n=1 Tax=Lentzea alba TaxID=2714351 RepID=UPI0039BFF264